MESLVFQLPPVADWRPARTRRSSRPGYLLCIALGACAPGPGGRPDAASGTSGLTGQPPGSGGHATVGTATVGTTSGVGSSSGSESSSNGTTGDASTGSGSGSGASATSATGGTKFDVDQPDAGVPEGECEDPELIATIRDFPASHPDMQAYLGDYPTTGIVEAQLGTDGKPVLADTRGQVTSATTFGQWYNTMAGINEEFTVVLPLADHGDGTLGYDSDAFFPIDNMGFGNEGYSHNFHFTTEIHTEFTFQSGQTFTFSGDDDLWMFIDGQLAMDLGGLHPEMTDTVNLDTLGLTDGQVYSLDIFHAERRAEHSNFKVTTSISCFTPPPG